MTTQELIIRNLASLLTLPQLQEQGLDVLVYGTCPDALTLTPKQELQLKVQMGKYLRQHLRLNQDLETVFTHLQANGLHPVLLKGQGCATYYPNPVLRATGDLDIYIGEKDYEKAKEVLRTFGCQMTQESEKHQDAHFGQTTLEIHRVTEHLIHPAHHRYYQQLSEKELAQPQIVTPSVTFPIPPASFNALQIFMHLWHHFTTTGIGLRQFIDLALILHRDHQAINPDDLKTHLKNLGRTDAWGMVGNILVDVLGLPQDEYPLYSTRYQGKAKKIFQMVLEEGNFGQKSGRVGGNVSFWRRKFNNLYIWLKRLADIHSISPALFWEQLWQMVRHTRDAFVQLRK